MLNAQAGEGSPDFPRAMAEHCLKVAGMQEVQPIKEMARKMSPEAVLDRIFSSVAPDFQKALLSKPADRNKPVNGPEAMRDARYFLPAIATLDESSRWTRVKENGRITDLQMPGTPNPDPNWARVTVRAQQEKTMPPFLLFLPISQRY